MIVKIIEAGQEKALYGKFLVARFDREEWQRPALLTGMSSLLKQEGWGPEHLLVLDLSRPGNGSIFAARKNSYARADLEKRQLLNAV